MNCNWFVIAIVGVAGICPPQLCRNVSADFITFTSSLATQQFSLGTKTAGNVGSGIASSLSWDASLGINFDLPKFNPTLGTLNQVSLFFNGAFGLTADILFGNNQLPPFNIAGITASLTTNVSFKDVAGTVTSFASDVVTNSITATTSATPFNFPVGAKALAGSLVTLPTVQNANYVGVGNVTLPMTVQFLAGATTSNGAFAATPFPLLNFSDVNIRYEFTAVPEPSTTLLAVSVLAAAWAAKRRRKGSDATKHVDTTNRFDAITARSEFVD